MSVLRGGNTEPQPTRVNKSKPELSVANADDNDTLTLFSLTAYSGSSQNKLVTYLNIRRIVLKFNFIRNGISKYCNKNYVRHNL